MTTLWESLLVALVVGLALLWALRAIWRYFRGEKTCTGCGSEGGCGSGGPKELLQDLAPLAGTDDPSRGKDTSGSSRAE